MNLKAKCSKANQVEKYWQEVPDNSEDAARKVAKASDYVAALQDPDAPELEPRKPGRPPTDGIAATGHIHIRTTLPRKNAYVRAAKPRKLTEWIFEQLDKASGFQDS